MKIAGLFGILLLISSGRSQFENLLDELDMVNLRNNLEAVEMTFGESLAKKLIEVAHEVHAGTFTPQTAVTFLEELTSEEREYAAQGIITLIQDLERLVSSPGTKDQIRLALQFAPIVLSQVINTHKQEDVAELKKMNKVDGMVVKVTPNETESGETKIERDMDRDDVGSMMENLMGGGNVPDGFLEIMEQLAKLAEEIKEERLAREEDGIDSAEKVASEEPEVKDELEAGVDEVVNAGEEKVITGGIKEDGATEVGGDATNKQNEKDEL